MLLRLVSMLLRFGICKAKGVVLQKQKAALRRPVECLCMSLRRYVCFRMASLHESLSFLGAHALNVAFGRPGSDLLSRVLRRSTIGAGAFHGRVRNGIGCSHPAVTTRSAKRNVHEKLEVFCLTCRIAPAGAGTATARRTTGDDLSVCMGNSFWFVSRRSSNTAR
jgi:hypothetical protein